MNKSDKHFDIICMMMGLVFGLAAGGYFLKAHIVGYTAYIDGVNDTSSYCGRVFQDLLEGSGDYEDLKYVSDVSFADVKGMARAISSVHGFGDYFYGGHGNPPVKLCNGQGYQIGWVITANKYDTFGQTFCRYYAFDLTSDNVFHEIYLKDNPPLFDACVFDGKEYKPVSASFCIESKDEHSHYEIGSQKAFIAALLGMHNPGNKFQSSHAYKALYEYLY